MTWLRAFLLALALAANAPALEVKEVRWGFDGKVVPGRFNLLSVLVDEGGPKAFEGELALLETRGMESTVGAPLAQPIFVTPGTQRWVQFLPFITNEFEWRLSWGRKASEKYTLPAPTLGAPGTVLLFDAADITAKTTKLKAFPEDLFPTSVAATDALDMLVLDHVPRWDAPRRAAFLDWLQRGGVAHIIRGTGGAPVFDGELAVLNTTLPKERVGAGWVARHDTTRAECSEEFLAKAGFAKRELKKPDNNMARIYGFDQSLLRGLASLTKPNVQWWLLYLLTIGYLVLIGPVHYRWARKVDYKLAIGGFLGTVAVFALMFIFAGSRGAGESQAAHSVAVARALGGGRWDVTQWISAFATDGDYYRLTHPAAANYYSATNDQEAIHGKIVNGKDGHFEVDIPLYSARPFLHRGVLSGPEAKVEVLAWEQKTMRVQFDAAFSEAIETVYLRTGTSILLLAEEGGAWTWQLAPANEPRSLSKFFDTENRHEVMMSGLGDWQTFNAENILRPLIAREIADVPNLQHPMSARPLAKDEAQLFVFAKAPDAFAMQGKGFRPGQGWVLYVVPIFQPAAAP